MKVTWPQDFRRVPDDDWAGKPIEELAKKYDTVEQHGWYDNLDPTLAELKGLLAQGGSCIDYSGGTGILVDRYFKANQGSTARFIIVDASPKFLRLALEKLGRDERVAFRWLRYLKDEKRLQLLDEVLPPQGFAPGVDCLTSTNAIHLYYDLEDTLASWTRVLRPGGIALVQSGNIRNPEAKPGHWIIDDTVEQLQPHALELARTPRYAPLAEGLGDAARMQAHAALRHKVFIPVRPLDHYLEALRGAGFADIAVSTRAFDAKVSEWYDFLSAYHEGVLGWAGGTAKIDGREPTPEVVQLRLELLRGALDRLFAGAATFQATWTYVRCRRAG